MVLIWDQWNERGRIAMLPPVNLPHGEGDQQQQRKRGGPGRNHARTSRLANDFA